MPGYYVITGPHGNASDEVGVAPDHLDVIDLTTPGVVGPYLRDTSNPRGSTLMLQIAVLVFVLVVVIIALVVRYFNSKK